MAYVNSNVIVNCYQDVEMHIRRMTSRPFRNTIFNRLNKTDSELEMNGRTRSHTTAATFKVKSLNKEDELFEYLKEVLLMNADDIQSWMEDSEDRSNFCAFASIEPGDEVTGRMFSLTSGRTVDCDDVVIILRKFPVENHQHNCVSDVFSIVDAFPFNSGCEEEVDFRIDD